MSHLCLPQPRELKAYKVGDWRRISRLDRRKGAPEGSIRGEGQPEVGVEEADGGVSQVDFMHSL